MANALFLIGILVLTALLLRFWRRMNLRYQVAEEDARYGGARYIGLIRLAIQRSSTLPFLSIGNGINGMFIVVDEHTVHVKLRGAPGRIAGRFWLGLGAGVWEASDLTTSTEEVPWNAEPFTSYHHSVVLDVPRRSGRVRLSVVPLDGDLGRLADALREAGVVNAEQPLVVKDDEPVGNIAATWPQRVARLAVSVVLVAIALYRTHGTFGPGTIVFLAIIAAFDVFTWNRALRRRR